jgi:hypothetical protein
VHDQTCDSESAWVWTANRNALRTYARPLPHSRLPTPEATIEQLTEQVFARLDELGADAFCVEVAQLDVRPRLRYESAQDSKPLRPAIAMCKRLEWLPDAPINAKLEIRRAS